jgi:hypothetical protein
MGVQVAMAYYANLAQGAAEAEYTDPSDAMEQPLDSYDDAPGVYYLQSSEALEQALIAEDDLDTEELWSAFDRYQEGSSDAAAGIDIACLQTEGWHLMDDLDDAKSSRLELQPSEVQVLFHRTETATSLKTLKTLGQKVYALTSWTIAQRSAFWALWKARREALVQQASSRLSRVRKAVAKILATRGADVPQLGKRLFAFSKSTPGFYPEEGWAAIWAAYL